MLLISKRRTSELPQEGQLLVCSVELLSWHDWLCLLSATQNYADFLFMTVYANAMQVPGKFS